MNEASKITVWHEDGEPWIEGKDTWVDLGYVPTLQTRCEFVIAFLGMGGITRSGQISNCALGSYDIWLGHMGTYDGNDFRIFGAPQVGKQSEIVHGPIDIIYGDVGSGRAGGSTSQNIYQNQWCRCIFGPNAKIDIKDVISGQASNNVPPASSSTIKLFADMVAPTINTPHLYCWAGFKYVKVFEGDTLVLDLVPHLDNGRACFMNTLDNKKYFGLNKDLIYHKDILKA